MKFTLEVIAARLPELYAAARRETLPLGPAHYAENPGPGAYRPDYDDSAWSTLDVGDPWGGPDVTCWLRVPVRVPESWEGQRAAVHVQLSDYGQYFDHLSGPEALAYLDGAVAQGLAYHHRDIVLGDKVQGGATHLLALEAYSSLLSGKQTLRALELVRLDPEAEALYHDLRVLHGAILTMPPDAPDRARFTRALERAYAVLDLRHPLSDDYLRSVPAARAILREEAYGRHAGGDEPRTVAVGHAHIDLAWLWPVAQTRRKGARTFSSALRLMEQYPAYVFSASQPALYEMVREDEPALYAQVKERIAQGRWEATGATWVEMDCNIAGGEALVRQFLHGKRYFRDELGVDPQILWLPDVFGYSAALPQIIKGCGASYFMTTKISWNEYNRLPYDTFRWRGIDGTEVLTHMVTATATPHSERLPRFYTYNGSFKPEEVAGNWTAYRQKEVNDQVLYLFGWGDGGGGPTAEMQETALRVRDLPGFTRLEQGPAEAFFRDLERRVWDDPALPRWVGELYLEYHRGTYTSQAWIKRANRKAELLYREAELWFCAAGVLSDGQDGAAVMAARQAELAVGWRSLLFNQFHDILPGSSINQVYRDARADHREIARLGQSGRDAALRDLVRALTGPRDALLLLNPAPFAREDPVEVTLPTGPTLPRLTDDAGRPITRQTIDGNDGEQRLLLAAAAPALGYQVLNAPGGQGNTDTGADAEETGDLRIARDVLENRFFRLHLDERAEIVSLYDKRAGREVVAPGEAANRFIAFEDRPLTFEAWDINLYYQDKPYAVDDVTSWRVVEEGPLRGGVEIVRRYGASTITQRILLYRDVPRIDFPTHVDWREHQTLLKVAFPVTVQSPRATFDIQWGNVERPTHWNTSWDWARFETCAHKWIDLSEGDYGVSLLNDCKYGHDVKGHTMRLTLIKSASYPDPEADQGAHVFSYALLPHAGDWRTGETVRHAYLFNMPAAARLLPGTSSTGNEPATAAALPAARSLVATDRPGLVIETVKPAEDGDGLIVRLYDAYGTRGEGTLTFARPIASAQETNMLEEPVSTASFEGRALRVAVRPYGISTFRIRLASEE